MSAHISLGKRPSIWLNLDFLKSLGRKEWEQCLPPRFWKLFAKECHPYMYVMIRTVYFDWICISFLKRTINETVTGFLDFKLSILFQRLGESKLSAMTESKDFRSGTRLLLWEKEKLTMEFDDLQMKWTEIQQTKVKKTLTTWWGLNLIENKSSRIAESGFEYLRVCSFIVHCQ